MRSLYLQSLKGLLSEGTNGNDNLVPTVESTSIPEDLKL